MYLRRKTRTSVTEQIDLEHDPTSRHKPVQGRTDLDQSGSSQDQLLTEIQKWWAQANLVARTGEDGAVDNSVQVISLDFCRPGVDRDLDVRRQTHPTIRATRNFLESPAPLNLKTRLLILHPVVNVGSNDLQRGPVLQQKLRCQFSALAGILATLADDTTVEKTARLLCLAGWDSTYSGGPGILEILSSRRQLQVSESEWSFDRIDTVSSPDHYRYIEQYDPGYQRQRAYHASFKLCCKKGLTRTPNITHAVMSCNYSTMVDQLCSRISGLTTSELSDTEIILQQASAIANEQTAVVLQQISDRLSEAKHILRREPSWTMNDYALYLQDHLDILQKSLKARLLSTVDATPPLSLATTASPSHSHQAHALTTSDQAELTKFSNAITILQDEAAQLRAMNKDSLANKAGTRNALFAVLAAIYLPFNLASSILGMNIQGLDGGTSPKWYIFLAIGLPLAAFTVALPLSFGRSYRIVRDLRDDNPVLLRRIVIGGVTLLTLAIITAIVVVVIEITKH